jgi:hypothetical protein
VRYPKAGDLQRATGVELTNPAAQRNPYEVRSASGLEGVFADREDAEFHADELRREGVPDVIVEHRRKRPASNPVHVVGYHGTNHRIDDPHAHGPGETVKALRGTGDFGFGMYFSTSKRDALEHGMNVYAAELDINPFVVPDTMTPELTRIVRRFLIDDEYLVDTSEGLWHAIVGLLRSLVEVDMAKPSQLTDELRAMGYNAIRVPNAIVRESRGNRDARGDYLVVFDAASIVGWKEAFGSIQEMREAMRNPSQQNPARRRDAEVPISRTAVVGVDQDGDAYVLDTETGVSMMGPSASEWAAKMGLPHRPAAAIYGGGARHHLPMRVPNPPRVLREKWGDSSEIVIESNRYGYTGWLESKRGGGRMPIAFGRAPDTAQEAMELAKKFLRSVYGRSNPADLTAKGERMYEHIKAGYGDDPRAKEIAARTVAARAKEVPGLRRKRR